MGFYVSYDLTNSVKALKEQTADTAVKSIVGYSLSGRLNLNGNNRMNCFLL